MLHKLTDPAMIIEKIGKQLKYPPIVVLFMGAAVVKNVGSANLTMTVDKSLQVAKLFDKAIIVPLHFEDWEHFTESATEIENKFREAGLSNRLRWAK